MTVRQYQESDHEALREITAVCFDGVSIDQNIEKLFGRVAGKDWAWRKKRHIDDDIDRHPDGIFVAELDNRAVGYVTTRADHATGIGAIPNLAVLPAHRRAGLGAKLMDEAIAHLKSVGMECVRIETLDQNAVGRHFYPKLGFTEAARQIHYVMRLDGA